MRIMSSCYRTQSLEFSHSNFRNGPLVSDLRPQPFGCHNNSERLLLGTPQEHNCINKPFPLIHSGWKYAFKERGLLYNRRGFSWLTLRSGTHYTVCVL